MQIAATFLLFLEHHLHLFLSPHAVSLTLFVMTLPPPPCPGQVCLSVWKTSALGEIHMVLGYNHILLNSENSESLTQWNHNEDKNITVNSKNTVVQHPECNICTTTWCTCNAMMQHKWLRLFESVTEQYSECRVLQLKSWWLAYLKPMSFWTAWFVQLDYRQSNYLTSSCFSPPQLQFGEGSGTSIALWVICVTALTNKVEHAFHRGWSCMCVCLWCILGLPQTMTFSMICITQLQNPQHNCWKSTLSVLWHPQPPRWIMQFTNTLENPQHATEQL